MRQTDHDWFLGRLSGASLWLTFSALAGCNVAAGLLGVGFSGSSSPSSSSADPAPRALSVSLRPGVSLFQAAAQAPRALSRAVRGLGELGDGQSLRGLGESLLDEGLLVPGALGLLAVRLEVQPVLGEPIAVVALAVDPTGEAPPGAGCAAVGVPPTLVGAYRAGSRLLLLRADGQFVLQGGAEPAQRGSYALHCQVLQLASELHPPLRLTPLGGDSWRDAGGSTFRPLTESPHGERP